MQSNMWRRIISLLLALALIPNLCWAGADFDGVDDEIDCGSNASLDNLSAMTISLWANVDTFVAGEVLVAKGNTGWRWRLGGSGTNNLEIRIDYNTQDAWRVTSDSSITLDVWQHFLLTWTGSSTATNIKIYVNGTETSYASTQNGSTTRSDDSASNLWIGTIDGTTSFIDASITEVAIWNMVLSADQIVLLAKSKVKRMPLQLSDPDADGTNELVGYWPMDEVADGASADLATFFDLSGNGNNGNPDNGANNTGMTGVAESVLSYPDEFAQ